MRLKICGATSTSDVETLAAAGADLVGLWYGIPGGRAELSSVRLAGLAAAAAGAAAPLTPVLVTFETSIDRLWAAAHVAGITRVQLHGYQQPAMVRAAKAVGLHVTKVLHVHSGRCVERPLIGAYQRAGVDGFLIDAVSDDGRLGSTAHSVDPVAVLELLDAVSVPVLLAGGLTAVSAQRFTEVRRHPSLDGIDVDTGARDEHGRFDAQRIRDIRRMWTVEPVGVEN